MHIIPPARAERHERDRYWRLRSLHGYRGIRESDLQDLLDEDGCTIEGSKQELVNASLRLQCGKTNYEPCEDSELRKFVHDRKLLTVAAPLQRVIKRNVLIELLMTADDQQSFDKFQDLPPELRERIAKYYLREFSSVLVFPTQPPLARTSRLVRKEVLPLFYQRCTFELHYEEVSRTAGGIKPCSQTLEWLYLLAPEDFSSIRNFQVKIRHEREYCDSESDFAVKIQLGAPSSRDYKLLIVPDNFTSQTIKEMTYEAELDKVLKFVVNREGGKFERHDIFAFCRAIEEGEKGESQNA